ncbi:MAG: crossover junction endodeoxyribonuclease RuvC [Eubacteriales bacterium]|nr:crossover junction endodeoxyribonuclease RuvC [Eubacteriales bacterium]
MIILGIDPGFAITGYGIVVHEGNHFETKTCGVVSTASSLPLSERLLELDRKLGMIISEFKPDAVAIEELFFNTNAKTAMSVGHGRGVAVLCAAKAGIEVFEYTPLQVKQAVAGYGRADKTQIQQMVKVILGLREVPRPDDAADALAIAICHAHSYRIMSLKER